MDIFEMGEEADKFNLTFVVNNKKLFSSSVKEGAIITAPTTDGEGNTITWYTYPSTMPAHNLVVYGMVVKQPKGQVYVLTLGTRTLKFAL
jgi:hypothetical protein